MATTTESEVGTQSQDRSSLAQPDDDHIFIGKLESQNFKSVTRILKSIAIRKVEYCFFSLSKTKILTSFLFPIQLATFHVTERGLKVIVQELGNFQATAYLQKDIFQYFKCTQPEVFFRISLDVLLVRDRMKIYQCLVD
jgi:hypothetical protein